MKKIIPNEDLCMGCTLCQVYCTLAHSQTKDLVKAYRRETPKPQARIKLAFDKPLSLGLPCRHCNDPPCVLACLTGAMHLDRETGRIILDSVKCIGCWTCVMVCPFGALSVDAKQSIPIKCDFCPELEVPACVANCPNKALALEEVAHR